MNTNTVRGKIKSAPFSVVSVKGVDEPTGMLRIEGYASTPNMDRMHEVVETSAFEDTMKQFMENPIMLYLHNVKEPVGHWDSFEIRDDGLWLTGLIGHGFHPADRARRQIEQLILKALSIGFREIDGEVREIADAKGNKHEVYHITQLELLEVSLVSIPANREALFHMTDGKLCDIEIIKSADDDIETLDDDIPKTLIGYLKCPTQAKDAPWSGAKARESFKHLSVKEDGETNYVLYRKGFTAIVGEADNTGSYKLPHHNVTEGCPVTNLRGCRAALGALAGGRGGVEISMADRKGAYIHLSKHIGEDFGEDVPAIDELGKMLREQGDEVMLAAIHTTPDDVDEMIEDFDVPEDDSKELDATPDALRDAVTAMLKEVARDGLQGEGGKKFWFMPEAGHEGYEQTAQLEERVADITGRMEKLEGKSLRIESALVKMLKIQFDLVTKVQELGRAVRALQ